MKLNLFAGVSSFGLDLDKKLNLYNDYYWLYLNIDR